jgi:uncharacterized protein YoxC
MTALAPAEDGRWRRRGLRILGSVLVGYGLTGIALFGIVLAALGPPIVAVGSLSTSLEQERQEVLDTLTRASDTITQTAAGVRGMDTSLDRAQAATNQASGLSSGMADNMHGLAQAMNVSVLGIQPLAGLAPSFEQSAASFETLGQDLDDIATALGDNRQSVQSVAASLDQLGVSVARLTTSIRTGPAFSLGADGSLDALRIATLAVLLWLSLAALGCVVAGIACWRLARRI